MIFISIPEKFDDSIFYFLSTSLSPKKKMTGAGASHGGLVTGCWFTPPEEVSSKASPPPPLSSSPPIIPETSGAVPTAVVGGTVLVRSYSFRRGE